MEKERKGIPHHKLALWIGLCLSIAGLLFVFEAGLTVLGRTHTPVVAVATYAAGTTASQSLGLAIIAGALVMFGMAWHLAGRMNGQN